MRLTTKTASVRAALLAAMASLACATSHDRILTTSAPRELQQETKRGPSRKVVRIIDGDTIVVDRYGTVRMLGIDTPELHHPTKPVERCAYEAREMLAAFLGGGERVRLSMGGTTRDKYGRVLAYVWRYGLVQERLLKSGLARSYFMSHPRKARFDALEKEAVAAKVGLWGSNCRPVPVAGT